MTKKISALFVALCILTNTVYANGGPVVIDAMGGYHIVPSGDNSVQILQENIIYNIGDTIKDSEGRFLAQVDITYIMENTNTEAEVYSIAFPLARGFTENNFGDVTVTLDGKEIDVETQMLKGQTSGVSGDVYDQGKVLTWDEQFKEIVNKLSADSSQSDTFGIGSDALRIAIFKIQFQPATQHTLKVKYYEPSKLIRNRSFLYHYSEWRPEFSYYLEPAKYWNSFKNLSVTINVPEGYYIKTNTLSTFKQKDHQYSYFSESLPDTNLKFSLEKKHIKENIMDLAIMKSYSKFILIFITVVFLSLLFLLLPKIKKGQKKRKDEYRKL